MDTIFLVVLLVLCIFQVSLAHRCDEIHICTSWMLRTTSPIVAVIEPFKENLKNPFQFLVCTNTWLVERL